TPRAVAPRRRGLFRAAARLRTAVADARAGLGRRPWRHRRRVRAHAARAHDGGRRMTAVPAPAIDLDGLLRRLHLPTVRRLYPDRAQRAEPQGMAYRELPALLLAEAVAHPAQSRSERRGARAG